LHVAKNVYEQTDGAEKKAFAVPEFMNKMVKQGLLGAKTGKGFYQKTSGRIYELDLKTFSYTDRKRLKTAAVELAKRQKGSANKIKEIIWKKGDPASDFIWAILQPV